MTRAFVAALLLACTGATAAAEEWPLRGWGVDERLEDPSVIAAALRDASAKTGDVPLFVRLDIGVNPSPTGLETGLTAIDTRVREYEALGIPVLLVVDTVNARPGDRGTIDIQKVTLIPGAPAEAGGSR